MLPENEFSSFIKKCFYPDPDAKGYYFCIDNQQTKRIILYAPLNWLSIEILLPYERNYFSSNTKSY